MKGDGICGRYTRGRKDGMFGVHELDANTSDKVFIRTIRLPCRLQPNRPKPNRPKTQSTERLTSVPKDDRG